MQIEGKAELDDWNEYFVNRLFEMFDLDWIGFFPSIVRMNVSVRYRHENGNRNALTPSYNDQVNPLNHKVKT